MSIDKRFLIFVVLAVLVLQAAFVNVSAQNEEKVEKVGEDSENDVSQDEQTSKKTDLSENFEGDKEVVAKGVKETISDDGVKLNFTGDPPHSLTIGNKTYTNIQEGFIKLNKKGGIKEANFLTNDKGGNYTINGVSIEAPPNSRVNYNGERFYLPDGSEVREVNKPAKIHGSNLRVNRKEKYYRFSGDLRFDENGQAYIKGGDSFSMNGVKVKPRYSYAEDFDEEAWRKNRINVFFDGDAHSGEYFSFGEKNFVMSGGSLGIVANFGRENPYLNIEEGDNFEVTELKNSELKIENRRDEGLVPKLHLRGENPKLELNNDGKEIKYHLGKVFLNDLRKSDSTSSPIKFSFQGTEEEVFVDNFNRFAIAPEGSGKAYVSEFEDIETKLSSRVEYNYFDSFSKEDTEKIFGYPVEFVSEKISEGEKQKILGRLRDYNDHVPSEVVQSVNELEILHSGYFEDHPIFPGSVEGYANPINSKVRIDGGKFNLDLFRHESSHTRHFDLATIPFLAGGDFTKEWRDINGEYDDSGPSKGFAPNYEKFEGSNKPKMGYARPYGTMNLYEDVATLAEECQDPDFWKPLLQESNQWHKKYRGKLRLLHEYNFCTNKEYNKILKEAGLKNE
ncbi:MAG: hypothetical protein ABEI74_02620 [Candidatus Pacearchaeota archaeon]